MVSARLYSQELNPFSEKVICALAIKQVPVQRIEVSDVDEIKRLSPEKQLLPVLEVDGRRVSESSDILRWIEELWPEPSLFADDPKTRVRQEHLAEWSDSSFAYYWNRWRLAREHQERERARASKGLLSRIHQHVEGKLGLESFDANSISYDERGIMRDIASRMDDLVGFLGSRDFFYSNQPSVADLAVFGMLLVMREGPMPGSAEMLAGRPSLVAHLDRMIGNSRLTARIGPEAGTEDRGEG